MLKTRIEIDSENLSDTLDVIAEFLSTMAGEKQDIKFPYSISARNLTAWLEIV